ncbi:MAG: hypothetical protein WDM81_20020 [Rhizomicrobium sp.]
MPGEAIGSRIDAKRDAVALRDRVARQFSERNGFAAERNPLARRCALLRLLAAAAKA